MRMPIWLFLSVVSTCLSHPALGQDKTRGANVMVTLNDGGSVEGEVLSVRDTAVTISTAEDESEDFLVKHPEVITIVRYQDVQKMIIRGESKLGAGMGKGFLIGAGTGALIGLASGGSTGGIVHISGPEMALIGGLGLRAVGFFIGTIAGIASSTSDREIVPQSNEDFRSLKMLARYLGNEPEFLQAKK